MSRHIRYVTYQVYKSFCVEYYYGDKYTAFNFHVALKLKNLLTLFGLIFIVARCGYQRMSYIEKSDYY